MIAFDQRIINVGIEVRGKLTMLENVGVRVSVVKTDNSIQNECEVAIANLDQKTRDFILTETSPLNKVRTPKRVVVDAGRASYGTARIIVGDIISSGITQPPDIWLTLKALTGNYYSGQVITNAQAATAPMSAISKSVADSMGLVLNFQATDKNVSNFTHNGSAIAQVQKLGQLGDYSAYVDDNVLVVKDKIVPLAGVNTILSAESGMIGIPEVSPYGVKVKMLVNNTTKLGGAITINSKLNPAANGTFCIYKLSYEIANRDTPFYCIAEAYKIQ